MGKIGYDYISNVVEDELILLYLKEGKPYKEAKKLAKALYSELDKMNREEKRLWRKVRKNEKTGILGEP